MSRKKFSEADRQFALGSAQVHAHPLFAPLLRRIRLNRNASGNLCPPEGWAKALPSGQVDLHPKRHAGADQWAYVIAFCALHYAFEQFRRDRDTRGWALACALVNTRFLRDLRFGAFPNAWPEGIELPAWDEERWYTHFQRHPTDADYAPFLVSGASVNISAAMPPKARRYAVSANPPPWAALFARGLADSARKAVDVAGGDATTLDDDQHRDSPGERARRWVVERLPLLGALALHFRMIEDPEVCRREAISVAAVSELTREIYLNPAAGLNEDETRFVIAHELLHVGLRHLARRQGRDAYLWNIACDFVINAWLLEMGIGTPPAIGLLYDPGLKDLSAESVYDRIVTDLRRYRKLATLAGVGACDMIERQPSDGDADWTDLDRFYREALARGMSLHVSQGRGTIPAGLIEEIRALQQPPIPWDVELAQWFDHHFPLPEKRRSYARLSRRQSATPDIPRPSWCIDPIAQAARTFGVVLDTSGSMDRALLGMALGAIASYSEVREVWSVRVVFCDAEAYDEGYLPPAQIAHSLRVKGRGGTVLQPGIDLLQAAEDFPPTAPILIITDGECDVVRIKREHAILTPAGARLPFIPWGPVFRVR